MPRLPELSRRTGLAFLAALVVVAAIGIVAWLVLRPASYSEGETTDATASVCAAYDLAYRAVAMQTNLAPPPDPAGPLAAAANARLALIVASQNLTAAVDAAPAAPDELTSAVRQLAADYRSVASNYLAGVQQTDPPITAAFQSAGTAAKTINATCKR